MTRYKNGFGIIEIIIILAIVGVLAGLGWLFFMKKDTITSSQDDDKNSSQSDKAPELQPETVMQTIQDSLGDQYTVVSLEKNNTPQKNQLSIETGQSSPPYKVDGYDYFVTYNGGSSLYLLRPSTPDEQLPTSNDAKIRRDIETLYYEFGLDSIESQSDASGNLTNVFQGKGLICTIDAPSAAVSGSTAQCGLINSYPAVAKAMEPFEDVLEHIDSNTILSGSVKQSKAADYHIANVSVGNMQGGGAVALLWKRGAGNWTLFRYVQNIPQCTAFTTAGLQRAFEGEPCIDSRGKTITVTPVS